MGEYYFVKAPAEEITVLEHWDKGVQIWTPCKVRRFHLCRVCFGNILKGQMAHRPITNKDNRYHRICESCMKKLREEE